MSNCPTIQTKMSSATTGIYCMVSLPFSGVMKDCSIVFHRHSRQPSQCAHMTASMLGVLSLMRNSSAIAGSLAPVQ